MVDFGSHIQIQLPSARNYPGESSWSEVEEGISSCTDAEAL